MNAPDPREGKLPQWYRPTGRASTDGTWLGAEIAEVMGTTDENEIIAEGRRYLKRHAEESLTGMAEEQADWEADE